MRISKLLTILLLILVPIANANSQPSPAKYAVVTAAHGGIGRAIAIELWHNGYSLILCSRQQSDLNQLAAELPPKASQTVITEPLDITDEHRITKIFAKFHSDNLYIDVLVNNAGAFVPGSTELGASELQELINTNLIGAHNMIRAVLPIMQAQRQGHIINISSIAGNNAIAGLSGYSASKYALRGLNDSLFKELAPQGIKVTSISPSVTDTKMTRDFPGFANGGKIQTEDLAKTVIYILSLSKDATLKDIEIYNSKMIAHSVHEQLLPRD